MPRRALVLGAGPAGLVCAWKLAQAGLEVELFEKRDRVGGMNRTWEWEGFLLETGPHIFHTPDPWLSGFWEREFGDLFVKGDFWCKNVKGPGFDEYWDYPLSFESISRYPRDLKEKVLAELSSRKPEEKALARNYTEYMDAEVGPTLRRMFFDKYPRKIWGIATDEMTPDWAPRRIEFRQKVAPFYHKQWNAAGRFGSGRIFERIRDRFLEAGGKINLLRAVSGFDLGPRGIRAVLFEGADPVPVGPSDVVISTIPITAAAAFLGCESTLRFRGVCSVYLAYDLPAALPEGIHWLYFDSEDVVFHRVTEGKKIAPETAPADRTCLTCEMTYSNGDGLSSAGPGAVMERAAADAERAGLAPRSKLVASSVNFEPHVYPLQYAGFQEELARVKAAIAGHPQLHTMGAVGEFLYADNQIVFHKALDLAEVLSGKESDASRVRKRARGTSPAKIVRIGGRAIGGGERPWIIAEAGLNHNGSLEIAKKLVDEAAAAGCDAVKFQTFRAPSRISSKVKAARYAETVIGTQETLFEMFERLAMPFEDQRLLFEHARGRGIEVFSTPFDEESADFLESAGVKAFKIASMDLVNLPLIRHVARKGRPLVISTGMATLGEVEEAVEAALEEGNPDIALLHCNSSYPAAPEEMNLRAMETMKKAFGCPVGLSDHTFGLFASHTAIAAGADAIERHFTLDRMMEGPDHILSSEPREMAELVGLAARIRAALGDGIKRIQPSEYDTINTQRKSLYAAVDIGAGEKIARGMIAVKGPGGGILPRFIEIVEGRTARRRIESDHPIRWEDV